MMNRSDHDLSCEEALEILEPLLDGELPAAEAPLLHRHLERCAACATSSGLGRSDCRWI